MRAIGTVVRLKKDSKHYQQSKGTTGIITGYSYLETYKYGDYIYKITWEDGIDMYIYRDEDLEELIYEIY